jgi:hypothetical protein
LHILTKLRFEKQKLQLINSSKLDLKYYFSLSFFLIIAGLHIQTKLRFEKQKLQLINSSKLDLTLEFLFYS